MKMNLKEMKTLYTFGCPNREATVERLRYVAALTPDPAAKKLFYMLSVKLSDEKCDKWYRRFYYNLRLQIQVFSFRFIEAAMPRRMPGRMKNYQFPIPQINAIVIM